MSTPTFYSPQGSPTAAKSSIVVVDAIADLDAPKAATELNIVGSVAIQCAIENFGVTTDVSWIERKKLCDTVATQRPGNRAWSMESMTLVLDDPQSATQTAAAKFVENATIYLVHRPGKTHTDAFVSGDKVIVYKCIVGASDLSEVSTDEGQEYTLAVQLGVVAKSSGLFATVAT